MSASLDKSIDVWDIDTEQRLAVWALDRDAPALAIRGDTICIGDRTGNVLFRQLGAGLTSDEPPCLYLPHEAWDEPRLQADCPHCHGRLRFNPFVVDGRDVETAAAFPRDNSFG